MKERTKIILILLALIAFVTVAALLIIKIDEISYSQGTINRTTYDVVEVPMNSIL